MRRALPVLVALGLVLTGCAHESSGPAAKKKTPLEVVRSAAGTPAQTSSRVELTGTTYDGPHEDVFTITGVFDGSASAPVGDMTMKIGAEEIRQIIVGGDMFMQVRRGDGYYRLPLRELGSTALGDRANPASSSDLLRAMGDDTVEVSRETIRGTGTTHYTGTISVDLAKQLVKDDFARKSVERLGTLGVENIPAEVFIDDQGRIRRFIQRIPMTIQGTKGTTGTLVTSVNQFDFYDFGVKVDVEPPPASQIKDGTLFLKALKALSA